MTPRGRPGCVLMQTGAARVRTGPRECAAVGCCEASAEAQTLVQGPCWAVIGSTHRCASLVDSAYDVSLSGPAPVGCQRCRQRARTDPRPRSSGQRSSCSPTPRVFHVESSRSLRVLSEYLGIDPTAEAADRRQLLLAPTSTPGNRRRGVRASAHISPPPAADLSAHTDAPALGLG
jgi:hypothetical protein